MVLAGIGTRSGPFALIVVSLTLGCVENDPDVGDITLNGTTFYASGAESLLRVAKVGSIVNDWKDLVLVSLDQEAVVNLSWAGSSVDLPRRERTPFPIEARQTIDVGQTLHVCTPGGQATIIVIEQPLPEDSDEGNYGSVGWRFTEPLACAS